MTTLLYDVVGIVAILALLILFLRAIKDTFSKK